MQAQRCSHLYQEAISYKELNYPVNCSHCCKPVKSEAIVFPLAESIFCSTDCAAQWFCSQCEDIYVVCSDRREEKCIQN